MENNYQKVESNINILAILQYVYAGITFMGATIFAMIYMGLGAAFMSDVFPVETYEDQAVLEILGAVFIGISIFVIGLLTVTTILRVLCGIFLQKHKHRVYCIVISAIGFVDVPFGTLLGIFTMIELEKPEAKELFNKQTIVV